MGTGKIILSESGPVVWITISNPTKHNAMSLDMWRQLSSLLEKLPASARCLVLRGEGARAFMSGADISEFGQRRRSPEDVISYDQAADEAMGRLSDCPIPTVALISGYCFGGGVATALSCDIRIAAEDSLFSIPAARLGLGYGWRCVKKLIDIVGVAVATDLLISARRVGAPEALRTGLVNQLSSPEQLTETVTAYAGQVARNAPLTIRAARQTIQELLRLDRNPDLDLCEKLARNCFRSEDYLEGMTAFMERREPDFHGR